ncbi:carbohydrate esterase family 3 protein [Tricladium varicosporioides]|nr:carbohydrate esterase family 3 protein [Hymenoscyphus varicosporioides]
MRLSAPSLLFGAACLLTSAVAEGLKVMPLGDSITEFGCWRAYLWDKLAKEGVTNNITFVGSMTDTKTCSGVTTWDRHHEGHAGYLAINIAKTNLPGWIKTTQPDIVFFHLGTNDVNGNKATADIIASFGSIVDQLRALKPKVKVIVSQIIPLPSKNAPVVALNAAIPAFVKSKSTQESPVTMVDNYTGFTSSDLKDGVHPNDGGDKKIANVMFPEVLKAIKESLAAM